MNELTIRGYDISQTRSKTGIRFETEKGDGIVVQINEDGSFTIEGTRSFIINPGASNTFVLELRK